MFAWKGYKMCRTQWVLGLVALSVGLTHSLSWENVAAQYSDVVMPDETKLYFYKNETLTHSEDFGISIAKSTYDAVHNRLLFIDTNITQNFLLYSYNLETLELHPLARRNMNKTDDVISLAYDPVSEVVFWLQSDAIFWFPLKPGFKNNLYGNLLMEFESNDRITRSVIAVDSCKGFIYWNAVEYVEDKSYYYTTIRRARLNGSNIEVFLDNIYGTIKLLAIDQQTQKMYWSNELQPLYAEDYYKGPPMSFSIGCVDLDGKNQQSLFFEPDTKSSFPIVLAVSNDSIYWTHFFGCSKLPKNSTDESDSKPEDCLYGTDMAINYKIEDQIQGAQGCEALISKISVTSDESACVPTDKSFSCNNYCIQGNCSISSDGHPQCSCDAGYSGQRCEVNVCQGYCLNAGECSLTEENAPTCQCRAGYEGERCEISACLNRLNKHFETVAMLRDVLNSDATHASQGKGMKPTCAAPIS